MEFVIAEVEGGVDGLEGLEIVVDLLFLSFLVDDGATVDD